MIKLALALGIYALLVYLNWLLPRRYLVWRPFGKPVEIGRCTLDGELVFDTQASLKAHAGHKAAYPVKLKVYERILVWLRILK